MGVAISTGHKNNTVEIRERSKSNDIDIELLKDHENNKGILKLLLLGKDIGY